MSEARFPDDMAPPDGDGILPPLESYDIFSKSRSDVEEFPADKVRFTSASQLADYLLNTKEKTGLTPAITPLQLYELVQYVPYEPELIKSLEGKIGGTQNLVYLCAAIECGPDGRKNMESLLKEFDDMLMPASFETVDFEGMYREARKKKNLAQKDNAVLKFPKK